MQVLTKPSLLIISCILFAALTFVLYKYRDGLEMFYKQRKIWETEYDSVMHEFVEYRKKMAEMPKSNLLWNQVEKDKKLVQSLDWHASRNVRPPVPEKDKHDKWIIVTSINKPNDDMKKLTQVKGWKLIVVADQKTPKDWKMDNLVFLSVEKQLELGYNLVKVMPWNNYGRKSIGYLYAIEHGAKYIYETDDDNHPSDGKLHFHLKHKDEYLVYSTKRRVVNAYEYLGQSTIWPRGYPLDSISDHPEFKVMKCKKAKALVQQGVVNGDPDVDAIFRLTRKDVDVRLDVNFDPKQEVILLPKGTLCPYNSQNTLYHYEAFWGLFLPSSINMRVTDIWRGYLVQRLLWNIGGHLSFFPPSAYQYRSAHNYLKDFKDEKDLYFDAGRLVDFLISWDTHHSHLFDQKMDMVIKLAHQGFIKPADIHVYEAWLQDLIDVGYVPPKLNPLSDTGCQHPSGGASFEKRPKEQPSSYLRTKKLIDVTAPSA